jgi:hypothetical protein
MHDFQMSALGLHRRSSSLGLMSAFGQFETVDRRKGVAVKPASVLRSAVGQEVSLLGYLAM